MFFASADGRPRRAAREKANLNPPVLLNREAVKNPVNRTHSSTETNNPSVSALGWSHLPLHKGGKPLRFASLSTSPVRGGCTPRGKSLPRFSCHSEPRSGEESREQKRLLLPPAAADRNSQNDSFFAFGSRRVLVRLSGSVQQAGEIKLLPARFTDPFSAICAFSRRGSGYRCFPAQRWCFCASPRCILSLMRRALPAPPPSARAAWPGGPAR